jgi:hypothetical protein
MVTHAISIPARFCGPPQSGNGGYVCGRLASFIGGPGAVRLKAPPPLEVELRVETDEGTARLFHGSTLIAVVVAWPLGTEGRKRLAGTAVMSGSGETVAVAKATWIEVPRDIATNADALARES